MYCHVNKFKSLHLFISVIETGSFAGAAKRHATDPSTVSKAIKRLEQDIGLQLFVRSTRKVVLTDVGQEYAQTVQGIYRQLEDCEAGLKADNDDDCGHLTINLPVSYGNEYVVPLISEFKRRYPKISLELIFSDEYIDMISHSIDLTIRSGNLSDSNMIAQKLSPMPFVICGAPKLAKTARESMTLDALNSLPWLMFRFKQTGKMMPLSFQFQGQRFDLAPHVSNVTVLNDGGAMMNLCADGVGLCLMPHFSAKRWVMSGDVEIVAKVDDFADMGVSVVYPNREYLPKRTRLFIDFLKESLAKQGDNYSRTWLDS